MNPKSIYSYFALRILRWAFGQIFGSKAKDWFSQNLDKVISDGISTGHLNYQSAVAAFMNSDFLATNASKLLSDLKIPAMYSPILSSVLSDLIDSKLNSLFVHP